MYQCNVRKKKKKRERKGKKEVQLSKSNFQIEHRSPSLVNT